MLIVTIKRLIIKWVILKWIIRWWVIIRDKTETCISSR